MKKRLRKPGVLYINFLGEPHTLKELLQKTLGALMLLLFFAVFYILLFIIAG